LLQINLLQKFLKSLPSTMSFEKLFEHFRRKTNVLYLAGFVVGVSLSIIMTNKWIDNMEKKVSLKRQELAAFNDIKRDYLREKAWSEAMERKLFVPHAGESSDAIIQGIFRGIGIEDKVASFKPFMEEMGKDYVKHGSEIKINKINLNQFVNLVYKIENHKNLLLIKSVSLDSRFDNPAIFDITIQVILLVKRA